MPREPLRLIGVMVQRFKQLHATLLALVPIHVNIQVPGFEQLYLMVSQRDIQQTLRQLVFLVTLTLLEFWGLWVRCSRQFHRRLLLGTNQDSTAHSIIALTLPEQYL